MIKNLLSARVLMDYLYLRYDVEEHTIQIFKDSNGEKDITQSDRVEVFFKKV